jgi:AcrR family transcriptional regulator
VSPRPRLTSDEAILAGLIRALGRLGPARLTLVDVAREAGVSPATLVQRFGSKRGLLLAMAASAAEANRQEYAALRRAHPSPTACLLALGDCMVRFMGTPEEISNALAFLQMDLTDADFRRHAVAAAEIGDAELRAIIADAVTAGELRGCEPAPLARVLGATLHGSLVSWAIRRKGTPGEWIRKDLETILRPYRTGWRARAARAQTKRLARTSLRRAARRGSAGRGDGK